MSPEHRRRLQLLLLLASLLVLLALLWQFTPACRQLDPDLLLQRAARVSWGSEFALFFASGCLAA
nr:hypothetical protein [Inhella sp.]